LKQLAGSCQWTHAASGSDSRTGSVVRLLSHAPNYAPITRIPSGGAHRSSDNLADLDHEAAEQPRCALPGVSCWRRWFRQSARLDPVGPVDAAVPPDANLVLSPAASAVGSVVAEAGEAAVETSPLDAGQLGLDVPR
jgi:hypothetical protein